MLADPRPWARHLPPSSDLSGFFHIHVHQLAQAVSFVAHRGGLGGPDHRPGDPVQLSQVRDLMAAQDPRHRARGHTELGADPVLAPPLAHLKCQDLLLEGF